MLWGGGYLKAQTNKTYGSLFTTTNFNKVINLAKPVGIINGQHGVNASGSATYSIQIPLPPTTNGVVPSISVSYNSQSGNGVAGYGWSVGALSAISRGTKNFYYDEKVEGNKNLPSDVFLLDGERLFLISGTYGLAGSVYGTENENFLKIEVVNDCANGPWVWRVTTKQGEIMDYGSMDMANNSSVNNVGNWVMWRLFKVTDKNGNFYEYIYDNTDNESRISEINFTGNKTTGLLPYNKVKFNYSIRKDKNTIYEAGLAYNLKYIIDNIVITGEVGVLFKTFTFNHALDNLYSYLTEVKESGTDGSEINSTIFKYGNFSSEITATPSSNLAPGVNTETFTGDFDGDGVSDLLNCEMQWSTTFGGPVTKNYSIWKSNILNNPAFNQITPTVQLNGNFDMHKTEGLEGYGFAPSDFNGDGKDDILISEISTSGSCLNSIKIHNLDVITNTIPLIYTYPIPSTFPHGSHNILPIKKNNYLINGDFDGDGRNDFITLLGASYNIGDGDMGLEMQCFYTRPFVTNGDNIVVSDNGSWNLVVKISEAEAIYPIDFNGDGKTDIMTINQGQCNIYEIVKDNSANGGYYFHNIYASSFPTIWHKIYFGDFNGDGKTDLLTNPINGGAYSIAYSTGTSFTTSPFSFIVYPTFNTLGSNDNTFFIADINGDGKSDIFQGIEKGNPQGADIYVYYSYGKGFETKTSFIASSNVAGNTLGTWPFRNFFGSFDGIGVQLFCKRAGNEPMQMLKFELNGKERLLNTIKNGVNSTIQFNYDYLTSYNNLINSNPLYSKNTLAPSTYPLITAPIHIGLVSEMLTNNLQNVTSYFYQNAIMHKAGKGFLGFQKITTADDNSNIKTVSESEINLNYYIALPKITQTFQKSTGILLNSETSIINILPIAGGRYSTQQLSSQSINHLQNITSNVTNTYDIYNNILQSIHNINNLETTTTNNTYINVGGLVPYLPSLLRITSLRLGGSSAVTKTLEFTYNNKGLLKSKTEFAGLPMAVTTDYTYNNFGNKTSETLNATSMAARKISFSYDSKGRFIISKSKQCSSCGAGFNQTESYSYHPLFGLPLVYNTSDCLSSSYTYDGFGKLITSTLPTGIVIKNSYVWDLSNIGVSYGLVEHPTKPDEKTYFDDLGREVEKTTEVMNGQWTSIKTTYNNNGQIKTKTNNYIKGVETPIINTYTYDAFNRLATESNGIVINNYNYSYNTTNSYSIITKNNNAGKIQVITKDATDKIVTSSDNGGRVSFYYDSWGNQNYIRQNNVLVTTNIYDIYNRKVEHIDINAGSVKNSYNAFGEVIEEKDASGNSHTYVFDNLGRVIERTGPEGTSTYNYYCRKEIINPKPKELPKGKPLINILPNDDNNTNGNLSKITANTTVVNGLYTYCCNNNITSMTDFNGNTQKFKYDLYGRLILKLETVDANVYTTKFKYDLSDNLITTTYPSAVEIVNNYDQNGFLLSVDQQGGTQGIYTTNKMDGMGRITQYTLGNGKVTNQNYTNGFVTDITTPTIQEYKYNWNYLTGNLKEREDVNNGLKELFTYDNLDRLTSSHVYNNTTTQWLLQQNYTYDPSPSSGTSIGNLKTKADAGFYKYNASQVHAQSSIANTFNTAIPPPNIPVNTQIINYTGFNRIANINEDGYQQDFSYWDGYGRMKSVLTQNSNLIETRYYFGDYEQQIFAGSAPIDIHYIGGAVGICAILVIDGGTSQINYVYKDHLGSINTITDDAGNIIAEQNYDAWGRLRNTSDWTYTAQTSNIPPSWLYRGFTGHESMPQFGLINMNARLYDPVVGKMISPDNYVRDPYSTQAYNRYAYANSNPMSYIDPSGDFPMIIIPIVIAAYSGGMAANNGEFNFTKWDNNVRTWSFVIGGAIVGAASGGIYSFVLGGGPAFATATYAGTSVGLQTMAIVASSFVSSVGMHIVSGGQSPVSIGFGLGQYNFDNNSFNGIWNWDKNSNAENAGYVFGAFATVQDLFAGTKGVDVVNHTAANYKAGNHHSWLSGMVDKIFISADHCRTMEQIYPGYDKLSGWKQGLIYAKHWLRHIEEGDVFTQDAMNFKVGFKTDYSFVLHNVNSTNLVNYTNNMRNLHNMISGLGQSKYGTLFYGCQGYAARALAVGAGIFTLPINVLPGVLTFQLYTRQYLMYASPYFTNH